MNGELEVLSVGRGHLRLSITTNGRKDREQAKRTIEGMLKQGYAIFVEIRPGQPLERVKRFDPRRMEYIIEAPSAAELKRGAKDVRLPVGKTRATVVGRTAGG